MKSSSVIATFTLVALLALWAGSTAAQGRGVIDSSAARALPDDDPVRVEWTDPKHFTEIRHSRSRAEAQRGHWVQQLAKHLQQRAAQVLGPGERLEILITDIDLAGEYEPVGGDRREVRVLRDLYPPRMQVSFVRRAEDGQIMQQGSRTLADPAFLTSTLRAPHDPLRFDKRMIEDWVRREFRSTRASPGHP